MKRRKERETCPDCQANERTYCAGHNDSGSQRWYCPDCDRNFTPLPNDMGHPPEVRRLALNMVGEGLGYRARARTLGITHQTVANWHKADQQRLPEQLNDQTPTEVIEVDELHSYAAKKKNHATL